MATDNVQLPLFDAHAHMYASVFAADLGKVLERAAANGVQAVLTVSETLAEAERILALSERYPLLKPCAGLYPTILDREAAADMLAFIRQHQDCLAAIGEVGLDYWKVQEAADREIQRDILAQHIAVSNELGLPLNVHSRSAGRHAIAWLCDHGARRVLLHAFDGKASAAQAGVEAGYFFSIPPSIVRSPQKQKLVRHLPLDRLLLESDSPVLGPVKGERNEPCNVRLACEQIATIKGLAVEAVAHATTDNARRLFPRAFA
jgi:TatD DNase family protein